jgi:hypothetical protein
MAKPLEISKWSILRVRQEDGSVEYRVFGHDVGMNGVALSKPLATIDRSEGYGTDFGDRDVILVDKSVPFVDSEYHRTMTDYAKTMHFQSVTDMTEMITTRTFLPPEEYKPDPVAEKKEETETVSPAPAFAEAA